MGIARQRGSAQASFADLNKVRFAFIERASAPNVPPLAFKLAHLLAYKYFNRQTWTARPAQETLARDLNVSVRTVQRLSDILEPLGLVIMPGNGRGLASTYSIDPERATRVSPFSAGKGDKKGRQKPPKRVTPVSPQLKRTKKILSGGSLRSLQREGERVRASREEDSSPSAGAPPLTRHPADLFSQAKSSTEPVAREAIDSQEIAESSQAPSSTEPVAAKGTPERECAEGVEIDSPAVIASREEQHWRALRDLWQRGWPGDDTPKAQAIAHQAFAKACREVEPTEIIEAAKTYVAAADAPRFLPALPQWLAAKGWEKPPPTKRRANGSAKRGNGQHKPNGYAKPDMFKIALEAGGYREDADGKMVWPGDGADDDEPLATSMWGGGQ